MIFVSAISFIRHHNHHLFLCLIVLCSHIYRMKFLRALSLVWQTIHDHWFIVQHLFINHEVYIINAMAVALYCLWNNFMYWKKQLRVEIVVGFAFRNRIQPQNRLLWLLCVCWVCYIQLWVNNIKAKIFFALWLHLLLCFLLKPTLYNNRRIFQSSVNAIVFMLYCSIDLAWVKFHLFNWMDFKLEIVMHIKIYFQQTQLLLVE